MLFAAQKDAPSCYAVDGGVRLIAYISVLIIKFITTKGENR
jgi:hypothetical protein